MTIELTPELEKRLQEEADKHRMNAHDYVRLLIERNLPPQSSLTQTLWNTLSPEEWIREFEAWTESHRHLPILPPEAYDRASFYEDRG
jgi:hypothetical protein